MTADSTLLMAAHNQFRIRLTIGLGVVVALYLHEGDVVGAVVKAFGHGGTAVVCLVGQVPALEEFLIKNIVLFRNFSLIHEL